MPYKPTGKPPGRPPGSPNKRTAAVKAAVAKTAERIDAELPGAFTGDAHALLMAVYKDPRQPIELRLEAAGKAIRYEKPALAAAQVTVHGPNRPLYDYTTAELEALVADTPEGQAVLAARPRKH